MVDDVRHNTLVGAVKPQFYATLAQFGVRLPTDLVVLSRALVTLDGTLRVLAPDLSLVAAATEMMLSTTAAPIVDRDVIEALYHAAQAGVPSPLTDPIGTIAGVSRSPISRSRRS